MFFACFFGSLLGTCFSSFLVPYLRNKFDRVVFDYKVDKVLSKRWLDD